MLGTSQGTPYPDEQTTFPTISETVSSRTQEPVATSFSADSGDIEFSRALSRAKENIERVEEINRESGQIGRTWSIPVAPELQSRTPIWSGRTQWQRQIREILNSDEGRNTCRHHRTDPERVFAVAVTMASFADQRTGRRVTASREVLAQRAGVSVSTLKRARRILSELGVAREMVRGRFLRTLEQWAAEAHHGRKQVKATSVWALLSPKAVVVRTAQNRPTPPAPRHRRRSRTSARSQASTAVRYPQTRGRDPQSVVHSLGTCSSVEKYKTTRASARGRGESTKKVREPRPIALQMAAAALLTHVPCLDTGEHIGSVCDALRDHYVDPARWSGRDIAVTLNADTRRRGWTWPTRDTLKHPVRYLRWRLAQLDWSLPSPTERAEAVKQRRDAERREAARVAAERAARVATDDVRAGAMAMIRQALSGKRRTQAVR